MPRGEIIGAARINTATPKEGILRRAWKRLEAGRMATAERVIFNATGKTAKQIRAEMS